ncbi:hypothetical protein BJ138DRAFT_1163149 [Hygrophoropsis aurantiaca]|uniref:Uncharacterized protein n=1 Tax=Hygrophoropsis aurantiaca TaxID=72124 RepID=A0ACB7ZZA2_9AGAM|nr:hypothetical protein BJ138DRAFT_1163149 [Hygrophoropsis aurantiaca]
MSSPVHLRTEELDIWPSSHEILDDCVLEFLDGDGLEFMQEPHSPADLRFDDLAKILSYVMRIPTPNIFFNPKFIRITEAKQLLKEHPKLQEVIRDAFRDRSFASIRNITMLWSPQARRVQSLDDGMVSRLSKSFVRPYIGAAVDGFFKYLKENSRRLAAHFFYSGFCSVVQSSGTGKSRLMLELRHKGVIVIYMNLRSADDKGYPERDNVPAAILTDLKEAEAVNEAEYFARCCHFFEALFKTIQAKFEQAPQDTETKREYIRNWNGSMCTMGSDSRAAFFDRVQAQYDENYMRSDGQLWRDYEGGGSNGLSPSMAMTTAYQNMLRAMQRISEQQRDEPELVIAFDEAHALSRWQFPQSYQLSHVLCRAIVDYYFLDYPPQSVWVVFASATSKVTEFSPPWDRRYVGVGGHLIFPPYVHLGWDLNAASLGDVAAKDVSRVDHNIPFGRPLWASFYDVAPSGIGRVISLARAKLCNSSIFDANDPDQALAVLSQRFCLGVCLDHAEAVQYVDTAVASHLSVCTSVTGEQHRKRTSYPSEPFLSCIAADLTHHSPESLENILRVLIAKIDSGMFHIGKNGELASRLLWLLAKDVYVRTVFRADITGLCTGGDKPEFIDCSGVPVIDFLEYVLGDPFTKALENTAARGGKEAFQGACINFSHWVTMEELITQQDREDWSSNDWTLRHYLRTSAVQCCYFQPLVDKMIPILFNDNEAQDSDCVSQLFISDKTSKTKSSKDSLYLMARDNVSINCHNERPWIAIVDDFGMEESACEVTFGPDKCLRIYISGINATSYPWATQFPSVLDTLRHLVVRQEEATSRDPIVEGLQRQVQFGSTSFDTHMRWELGKEFPHIADDHSTPEHEISACKDETTDKDRKGMKRESEGEPPTTVKKSKVAK